MTKLSPQYQAWRARKAEEHGEALGYASFPWQRRYQSFLAGAEAEHEAAKLVGRLEALQAYLMYNVVPTQRIIEETQARLDALLRGGGEV